MHEWSLRVLNLCVSVMCMSCACLTFTQSAITEPATLHWHGEQELGSLMRTPAGRKYPKTQVSQFCPSTQEKQYRSQYTKAVLMV